MNGVKITVERINALKPLDVVDDELVRQRFIDIYSALWGESEAEAAYEREAINFRKVIGDSENLKKCTAFSVFIAFIDLAVCGLSLEQGVRALAYLQPRKFKVGLNERGGNVYEGRCCLTISGYGELVLRTRAGQIRHADNPVIVYEGDDFSFTDQGAVKKVSYTLNMNHNPEHIVACYLRITRADGTTDYSVMLESDWKRLEDYSGKANRYWDNEKRAYVENANSLYSSGAGGGIDTGFLIAKCIKHAFNTYPKVRIGKGTSFEADHGPKQEDDFYRVEAASTRQPTPNPSEEGRQADSFAEPKDTAAGVTVEPGEDDTF